MSFGGSKQKSSSDMQQDVWGMQGGFLEKLFGGAQQLQQQQQGQVKNQALQLAAGAIGMGDKNYRSTQAMFDDIFKSGGGPLAAYARPNNALARQQLGHQATSIGNEFQRVVMPALNSAAGVAGGLGGSRNQIARGMAASDAQQQIASAGSDLYAQQYGIGAQAAAGATQAKLDAASGMRGLMDWGAQRYNLGMSPFTAQWAPLTALAQILGSPTVLAKSKQKGSQKEGHFGLF